MAAPVGLMILSVARGSRLVKLKVSQAERSFV